jgi:hypothetical protein
MDVDHENTMTLGIPSTIKAGFELMGEVQWQLSHVHELLGRKGIDKAVDCIQLKAQGYSCTTKCTSIRAGDCGRRGLSCGARASRWHAQAALVVGPVTQARTASVSSETQRSQAHLAALCMAHKALDARTAGTQMGGIPKWVILVVYFEIDEDYFEKYIDRTRGFCQLVR